MITNFRTASPIDPDDVEKQAADALANGREEELLPALIEVSRRSRSARLWQWAGLLQRSIDEHAAALGSFHKAAELAPDDAGIAHGLARTALEAGLDATPYYEKTLALGQPTSDLLLGRAAARMAQGQGELAIAELQSILAQMPFWLEGQAQVAQLQSLIGHRERAYDAIERALGQHPRNASLWHVLLDLNLKAEDYSQLAANALRANRSGICDDILGYRAIAASELGLTSDADALFASLPAADGEALSIWRVRYLLRTGRPEEALPLIDRQLAGPDAAAAWPYASLAWKLTGDRRSQWLEPDSSFVGIFDLGRGLGDIDRLSQLLRSLHVAKSTYLDQSVRGGTQTDGPLLSRIEPEIRQLRGALVETIEDYVVNLPPPDPAHPLLGQRRDRRIRFAGSWSVRLRDSGYHESHVHPQGWISSALYLELPGEERGPSTAGWLSLGGSPQTLGLRVDPMQTIEPRVGRLVLFPSWMWHRTIPFEQGDRLTVAFDVRPPI